MDLKPILSALLRHKVVLFLLVLVIALSCGVVSNSVFLMTLHLERLHMPAGFDEDRLVEINADTLLTPHSDEAKRRTRETADALRQIPGVQGVTLSNQVPLDYSAFFPGYIALNEKDAESRSGVLVAVYGGEEFAKTLGLRLVAGRWLNPLGFVDYADVFKPGSVLAPSEALITTALAKRVWPGQNPLGKQFYFTSGKPPTTVVGVVEHLPRPNAIYGPGEEDYSIVLPMRLWLDDGVYYLLRTADPSQRQQVLHAAVDTLHRLDPHVAIMSQRPVTDARKEQLGKDLAMARMLAGLCVTLLLITGLGIVGLSSYWVQQRRRHIGVRRALGATRTDILRYFMLENFLLTSLGVMLGMALAYGLSALLMHYYELPRLPWFYFPLGAVALWVTGQLAVLAPALRASCISPAAAAAG
ncbi:ABC transporter permease [Dyella flagellata]|uniref:ABC transporter permease n=1 Tax=Dyella flagellata TaxID=1867833 RepID=A0ABQ5XAJ1_9GAMM|nr:FtsX-like permease family protein [Dyella flagellata]GLQ88691.1 ABC transporter permease [Dyella flagellata]